MSAVACKIDVGLFIGITPSNETERAVACAASAFPISHDLQASEGAAGQQWCKLGLQVLVKYVHA